MIDEVVKILPPGQTSPLAEMSIERDGVGDDPAAWVARVAE